jgi:hypothetical protein
MRFGASCLRSLHWPLFPARESYLDVYSGTESSFCYAGSAEHAHAARVSKCC